MLVYTGVVSVLCFSVVCSFLLSLVLLCVESYRCWFLMVSVVLVLCFVFVAASSDVSLLLFFFLSPLLLLGMEVREGGGKSWCWGVASVGVGCRLWCVRVVSSFVDVPVKCGIARVTRFGYMYIVV